MTTSNRWWMAGLLLLAGCGSDIYDTWLVGEVRIAPAPVEEGLDYANETFDTAEDLGELGVRPFAIAGVTEWFAYKRGEVNRPPPELPGKADEDWYKFAVVDATTASFNVRYADADRGVWVRVGVYEIGETESTELYVEDVLVEEGDDGLTWTHKQELSAGTVVALRIGGIAGDRLNPYAASVTGADPSGMKVGAFAGVDGELGSLANRGDLLGGAEVQDFALADDGSWRGTYEIVLGQGVGPTDKPNKVDLLEVDAGLAELWLVPMNSDDLAAPIGGGTLHASVPLRVDIENSDLEKGEHEGDHWASKFKYIAIDTLLVDSQVPPELGWWLYESEPNDVTLVDVEGVITPDVASLAKCEDAGTLTGPGRADRFEGAFSLGRETGPLAHETDCFGFKVPESVNVSMSLAFDAEVADNLDVVIWDAAGQALLVAQGGPIANPDVAGPTGVPLEPGVTYYAMVIGQAGSIDGVARYTLDVTAIAVP